MKLLNIRQDRANHFIYGLLVYLLANIFFTDIVCFGIVLTIAFAKECYDEYNYGGFDIVDLIYTIIPSSLIILKTYYENK